MVRSKVNSLRKTVEFKRHGILELISVKECLKELQEKYVFLPADKAANNIIVVCKRYYMEVICKELGLWSCTTSSDTYIPETMDPKEISINYIDHKMFEIFVSHAVPSPEGTHILGFPSLLTFLHNPQ